MLEIQGDIIGPDTVTVQEGKDHAQGKEKRVVTGEHHLLNGTAKRLGREKR